MAIRLAKDILHFLREQAAPTSLRKLQRQGIESATVLDMDQIEDLVTRAVDRVLRQSDIDPAQTAKLGRDARQEFLRLLHDRNALKETVDALGREHDELRQNFTRLRTALGQAQSDLDAERAREEEAESLPAGAVVDAKLEPFLAAIRSEIANRVRRSPAGLRAEIERCMGDLPLKLVEVARRYLDREADRVRVEERQARHGRIHHLEQRVTKLKGALADTEEMLERVRSTRPAPEGVSSLYESPQGLAADEPDREKKKGLLSEIFRLNIELRELISQDADSS